MERLTCNELKIYDGCFVNMAKREESRKYSLLIESAPTYEEIYKKLTEYENLEEQGLLLRLPCKVGDTVWCIFEKKVYKAIARKVTNVKGLKDYELVKIEAEFDIIDPFYSDGRLRKCGVYQNYLETVFLTKEEAEQKLAEMQQSHAEAIMDERNGRVNVC